MYIARTIRIIILDSWLLIAFLLLTIASEF
jgi:hypothetical protein